MTTGLSRFLYKLRLMTFMSNAAGRERDQLINIIAIKDLFAVVLFAQ